MKKNSIFAAIAAAFVIAACTTDVEVCTHEEHPHYAKLTYSYDWTRYDNPKQFPDSMNVVAYRVVNHWKSSMNVESKEGKGHYIFNEYDKDTRRDLDTFNVRAGAYKFVTFSMDTSEFIFDKVDEFLHTNDPNHHLQDVTISYKSFHRNHPDLKGLVDGWEDYNPYTEFVQPNIHPVFYDSTVTSNILIDRVHHIEFEPKRLTQDIDIFFNIHKLDDGVPFRIDSVRAEIAGIPRTINLSNGYFDITKTYKMLFTPTMATLDGIDIPDGTDTDEFRTIRCHGHISVPTIVNNNDEMLVTGPGIMQVLIFLSADDATLGKRVKKVQGKINLHNTLAGAELIERTPDGQFAYRSRETATLDIKATIEMTGSSIIASSDNLSGLDAWIPTKSDDLWFDI